METIRVTPFAGIPKLEESLRDNLGWLDEAIDETEAARLRGKSKNAVAIERCRGKGPDFIRDGRGIRYTRRAIFEYHARNLVKVDR
jgi:hypothetical protein